MKMISLRRLAEVIVLLLIIISKSFGQLKGTYTIGGSNPDYTTIYKALNDVNNKGVSGTVVFNIRPGTYQGFSIGVIPTLVYPDSILFQSETHDSSDVIISSTVTLDGAKGITLKWLTIEDIGVSSSNAIQFKKSYHINILNCLINTPNSRGDVYDSHAAFHIGHNWALPLSSIRIENCILTGKGCGFYAVGEKGITQIINCKLLSTGIYSIATNWVTNLTVKNCYLPGNPDISGSGPVFKNNVVIGKNIDVTYFTLIEGNEFISLDDFPRMNVQGNTIRNNRFRQYTIANANIIESNTFDEGAEVSRIDNVQFFNNTVSKEVKFLYCNYLHMYRNIIHGTTRLAFADLARVYNNIFYGLVTNGICSNNKFYYNNFVDTALFSSFFNVDARYNNFNREVDAPIQSTFKYNNYYPSGGLQDQHPYHYNPDYSGSSNPRARNPLLMGKGEQVSFIKNDIDGVVRPKNPTVGVNEICISSFGEINNIEMVCGDEVLLKRCGADTLSGYRWYPSIGLSDTISATPIAKPLNNTKYYLTNTKGVIIDSVMIEVKGFSTEGFDSFYLGPCGGAFLLSKNFNHSASYHWSPASDLSDTIIHNPLASPKFAKTYIQEITIPGCGFFVDSTFLDIDPTPTAYAFYSNKELEVTFGNYSSCADSFQWNFGDGLKSTDEEPVHSYDTSGYYDVSLIAMNDFGKDTYNFTIYVATVGIKDIDAGTNGFKVYPNPSIGLIHIELYPGMMNTNFMVYNFLGQLVHSEHLDSGTRFDYNLPETKGVYSLQFLREDGKIFSKKVIKK